MVTKQSAKAPDAADDDHDQRGASDASSSAPQDSHRNKKASLKSKSKGNESKKGAVKNGASEEKTKANASIPSSRDSRAKPMETEVARKPSNKDNGNTDDNNQKPHHEHHHHHHHHGHRLNDDTINRLKAYLQSERLNENLDEDAIAIKMLRTDKAASDRVRFLHDPYADSDEEEATPKQSYQAAEDYTLAMSFYKKAIAETQDEDPNVALDKRTLNWLQKALGLHRRNELWETTVHGQQGESDESEGDEEGSQQDGKSKSSRRTVTRGMVRSTRIKRRAIRKTKETVNLNALFGAVEDLEGEFGPFNERSSQQTKRKKMAASDDECTENRRPKKKRSPKDKASLSMHLPSNKKTYNGDLVAHFPTRVKEVGGGGRPARRSSKSEEAVKVRLKLAGKGVRFKTHSNTSRKRSASLMNDSERRRQKREQKATGAPLMSLGIVEWRRRQQWNPTCSDETNLSSQETAQEKAKGMSTEEVIATLSTNASETEVSINLPVWDSVNPMPCVKQRPAVMERRRHSDDKYAEWINVMVNILSGSGRSWALHEFFYSDIDRAWYNFDQFQVDVAKLGVPHAARLTRKEWSLVRRSLRKRPRRFSRRFIQSELAKLCQYRDIVRAIQHSGVSMPDFGFQVPAYIKVGATVTAIHWQRRVLHRGIVLGHDPFRSGYLVQFERKELGFQFCPDYEVATHGMPETLLHASDATLEGTCVGGFANWNMGPGELSYGTSRGPMYSDQLSPLKKDRLAKFALLDAVVPNDDTNKKPGSGPFPNNTLVERVAERETLVELIATIEAGVERKTLILDAINKCNKDVESFKENDNSKLPEGVPFAMHYAWLQANLRMTNQSLESALALYQTMYRSPYMRLLKEEPVAKNVKLETQLQRLRDEDNVDSQTVIQWSLALEKASQRIGSLVTRTVKVGERETISKEEELRDEYMDEALSGACRFLLSANYCGALVRSERSEPGGDKGLFLSVAPMNANLQQQLRSLQPKPLPPITGDKLKLKKLHRVDEERNSAMKELQEALKSFEAEMSATHISNKILRS